jgi:glycosyltransferase involved in cell wall biosynthesis
MGPRIFIIPAPAFKGRVEQYIAEHIVAHISGAEFLVPPIRYTQDPGEGFYETGAWMTHQREMVKQLVTLNPPLTSEDQLIFTDFWFPGLDMLKLELESRKITPKLVGFLLGASFVAGDLLNTSWQSYIEMAWMEIYDGIWAASKFFITDMPEQYIHKVQITGLPFEPEEFIGAYRNISQSKLYDIVYPHRLAPDKGFDEFIDLLELLSLWQTPPKLLITAAFPPGQQYLAALTPYMNFVSLSIGKEEDGHLRDLASAKIVLSTAIQEGWGYAVLKAISVGCVPVLPNRAVYPELYEKCYRYDSLVAAETLIKEFLTRYPQDTFIPPKTVIGGKLVNGILIP